MLPQIKLTVTHNDKLVHTVTKTIEKQHFIKSLEEFQLEANAALTKMIEELGEIDEAIGDASMDDDDNEETDDDEDNDDDEDTDDDGDSLQYTDMESKRHSESKKKKHN